MLDAYSVLTELQELLKDGTQNTRTLARVADGWTPRMRRWSTPDCTRR